MIPDRFPRLPASQALRLVVAAPCWAAGLALMAVSIGVPVVLYWLVGFFLVGAFYGISKGLVPAAPDALFHVLLAAVTVAVLCYWGLRLRRALWNGYRTEPASMVARTRTPDADAEQRVRTVLERLCLAVDLPTPAVRVADDDEPLAFSVRYPVETPPEEVLETNPGAYRAWSAEHTFTDVEYDADAPVPEDHVVVVSTGLVEALSERELTAVLAHEVAHLRNRDLALVNALLLPIYWGGSLAARVDSGALEVFTGLFVTVATVPGVAAFTRGREVAADAAAAATTGDPAALASALERLEDRDARPEADVRTAAVLNVLPPRSDDADLLSRLAHPPTERRIDRLRSIADRTEP